MRKNLNDALCHILLVLIISSIPKADLSSNLKLIPGHGYYEDPYIGSHITTNVTTQIGTHAYLPCKVKQLGNKSVSWVRVRDDHILTVDRMTFIADERFQAFYVENTGLWTLQIKYVQARDAGMYECQVSTEPKISARVHLHVVVPRTELIGDPDRYVKAESTVILRCIVRGALEPPAYIIWYHGSKQLFGTSSSISKLNENHHNLRIKIDRGKADSDGDRHSTVGSLIIETARKRDSGNYSCSPSNSPPVTVTLHIINGESSSAITSSSASNHNISKLHLKLTTIIIFIGINIMFF